MIYFGLYWVGAAVYGLYAIWSWTTFTERLEKWRIEYERKTGIKIDPKLLTCYMIVWDTVTWPIGLLIVLYVRLKFTIKETKTNERKRK